VPRAEAALSFDLQVNFGVANHTVLLPGSLTAGAMPDYIEVAFRLG